MAQHTGIYWLRLALWLRASDHPRAAGQRDAPRQRLFPPGLLFAGDDVTDRRGLSLALDLQPRFGIAERFAQPGSSARWPLARNPRQRSSGAGSDYDLE